MVWRYQAGPLPGIPKRDFLKPNTIAVRRRTDMEVSRHDNSRIEAEVPIFGAACPAPDWEARYSWKLCEIFPQWKVIDQHCRQIIPIGLQSLLCNFAAGVTPLGEVGIWIWMQEHLVGALDSLLRLPSRLLALLEYGEVGNCSHTE